MSDEEAAPRRRDRARLRSRLAALATLFVSVAFGILASIQLLAPEWCRHAVA